MMQPKINLPRYHEELTLENFTCFGNQTLNFVDHINIFVGENGTGKTHAMKVLYAAQKASAALRTTSFHDELKRAFQIEDVIDLRSKGVLPGATTTIAGVYGGQSWHVPFLNNRLPDVAAPILLQPQLELPVFIPAIDMLGHSKGFLESANLVELDFDSTCSDILTYLGTRRKRTSKDYRELVAKLREVVQGEIVQDETKRFFLVDERGSFPMPMVAEGIRKVATLRKLVENNWFTPGTTLFWDEPEVNLNPKIMDEVVQALLMICRRGVQVFLATHSYLILKELEVARGAGDTLRFFSFECSDRGTLVNPSDTYLGMHPNLIERQYAELYDRQIQKEITALEENVA